MVLFLLLTSWTVYNANCDISSSPWFLTFSIWNSMYSSCIFGMFWFFFLDFLKFVHLGIGLISLIKWIYFGHVIAYFTWSFWPTRNSSHDSWIYVYALSSYIYVGANKVFVVVIWSTSLRCMFEEYQTYYL